MLHDLRQYAARHGLWQRSTRIIAAVSGGSDSVALLTLLHDFHTRGELHLDAVAHLNHGIRGREADEDEAFCRDLAARLDVAFVARREDVPGYARQHGMSLEVAARTVRHRFFDDVRRSRQADVVATAHTADDQAETVVLRIVRGTGLRGLGGLAPRRGRLVRPLLERSRLDLREYLHSSGEGWRDDPTNLDLNNPRNRVRHELMPYLARQFNPRVTEALTRLATLARADDDALDREATAAAVATICRKDDRLLIDVDRLAALPEATARRVIREAVRTLGGRQASLPDVERIREVAGGTAAGAELPGLRVEHSGRFVVLVQRSAPARPSLPFRLDLPVPGSVEWPAGGWALDAEGPIPRTEGSYTSGSIDRVAVDAAGVGSRVVVRQREPGDRIRPLGMDGRKKLQDVLVDRKVPPDRRDLVPIVTDHRGRLIWVAGHVLAEDFRVTTDTNAVVILKLRRI